MIITDLFTLQIHGVEAGLEVVIDKHSVFPFLGLISPSPSTKSAKSVPSTRDIDSGMILCSQYSIVFSSVSNIQNYLIASILVFMSTNEKAKVDLGVVILSPCVC